MCKKKNGFTLVELLAIIVILGVIAVIVIPKIVDTVESTKVDSAAVSAKGFTEAITKYYMENNKTSYQDMMNENYGLKMTGSYIVENGHIKKGDEDYLIPINGTAPTSGNLEIQSGVVISGCITIGKYSAIIDNSNIIDTLKADCSNIYSEVIEQIPGTEADDGYKYITTPIVVYYDPISGKICDNALNGCMKWYAYSIKNGIANLILDHNINTEDFVSWINESDYNDSQILGSKLGVTHMDGGTGSFVAGSGNHDKGPLTTLKNLKELTSNWGSSVMGDYKTFTANISDATYVINYSNYNARLITAQEVAYIAGTEWEETTSNAAIEDLPNFLLDNLVTTPSTTGYWTASPVLNASDGAWFVSGNTNLHGGQILTGNNSKMGIRPVISLYYGTIKKFVH